VLTGGPGDDEVDGGRGQDSASLGSGDDRLSWDPGDASDTVDGDAGHDTLVFNGYNASEHDLPADSSHDLTGTGLKTNTLAGNATASVAFGVSSLIQPIIDLGTDE
jgi:Ca2+-binding RTX toxin-like protein